MIEKVLEMFRGAFKLIGHSMPEGKWSTHSDIYGSDSCDVTCNRDDCKKTFTITKSGINPGAWHCFQKINNPGVDFIHVTTVHEKHINAKELAWKDVESTIKKKFFCKRLMSMF